MFNNDFFINLKPSQIPKWNNKKNFWEQSPETLSFWLEEWDKVCNGITIHGVFIHPWLYFHINHFKTPIPQKTTGQEEIVCPTLRDNEWYIAECIKSIMHPTIPNFYTSAMLLYGSRRYSKTTMESSFLMWTALTRENARSEIICGSTGDLQNIALFLKQANTNLAPAFKIPTIKKDWENLVIFGFKEGKTQEENIYHSISIKNANDTSKKSDEKTAGGAPVCALYDEIGKFSFKASWLALQPALKTPHGIKGLVIMSGTSGTEDLSRDAYEVLASPSTYGIAPMNWDTLENFIDPEFITWKRRTFGFFMPPQMAYEEGLIKEEETLSEFLKIEDKNLQNIKIEVTNWENSNKVLKQARKDAEKDPEVLKKEKLYHPLDPEDCFISGFSNPFPATQARLVQQKILESGDRGRKVKLYKSDGVWKYNFSELEEAPFPYSGGIHNAPVILYGDLPKEPIDNLHVGSMDPYKQVESNTSTSLGCVYILERPATIFDQIDLPMIKAVYTSRPTTMSTFNNTAENLLDAFFAKCMMENADGSFLQHLTNKNRADELLVQGLDWAKRINPNTKVIKLEGWHPSPKNKSYVIGKAVEYANREIELGVDEYGQKIIKLGIEFIPDYYLLEEMISFRPGGNYDRIITFGAALAWIEYLDSLNIYPVERSKVKRDIEKEKTRIKAMALRPINLGKK